MSTHARNLPSLDGLRALSIGFVMFAHVARGLEGTLLQRLERRLDLGVIGVRVFFVISGFLITTLLLREHQRSGRVSLRRFYFRRCFRIFPAFYAFLAALVVARAAGWVVLHARDLGAAALYVSNFVPDLDEIVGHTWSLSVEEQFYLLWPAVLLAAGARRATQLAAAYVLIAPLWRVASWQWLPAQRESLEFWFPSVADALACGCVLAGVRARLDESPLYRRVHSSRWFVLAPLLTLGADATLTHPIFFLAAGQTVMNLGIALCLDWCLRHPASRIGRALNWRPIATVGVASYSLYLWQQPFLQFRAPVPLAIAAVGITAGALASYHLVERPFLRLRERLERKLFMIAP